MTFTEKKFDIRHLEGISTKNIEEHLKLYAGYVKHSNLILEKIAQLTSGEVAAVEAHAFSVSELQRRFGFEFDGMRNHEYYFEQFTGSVSPISKESSLGQKITEQWESYDAWLVRFKTIAMTRGVGWAILYFDPITGTLMNGWVEEQHLGHLVGLKVIIALDMWEHSYMLDYVPSEKKKYVEAFFANIDGTIVEKRFADTTSL